MSELTTHTFRDVPFGNTDRRVRRMVRLEAEGAFTETRPGSSLYHAHVYRIDDDGERRVFADAYGDTAEEALVNAEGIARTLNTTFAGR